MQLQLTSQGTLSGSKRVSRLLGLLLLTFALTLWFSTPVLAVYYTSGGGGGGDSAGVVGPPPTNTIISDIAQTEGDRELNQSLAVSTVPTITLADNAGNTAVISPAVVESISDHDLPLVVTNNGVALEFPADALMTESVSQALNQNKATVNISAVVISRSEADEIRAHAQIGESTGIFSIGSRMVSLNAYLKTSDGSSKITEFNDLVAVTIDFSDKALTEEQIRELTAVRVIKNSDGSYSALPLGGSYDSVKKTFTFYTNQFSVYSVVQKSKLVNINMVIDNLNVLLNGSAATLDVPPMILNSRTMIPLRFVGEKMGMKVDWNSKTRTITMTQDGKTLTLVVDKLDPAMDVPATIINNRTMVPIRYVSENFGATVNWIASTRTVQVFK